MLSRPSTRAALALALLVAALALTAFDGLPRTIGSVAAGLALAVLALTVPGLVAGEDDGPEPDGRLPRV